LTFISNITNESVTVNVTYYDQNGNIVSDDGSATTGTITAAGPISNYDDNIAGKTMTFDLAPHSTAQVEIFIPSLTWGYGRITWKQESDNLVALVAFVQTEYRFLNVSTLNGIAHNSIMVNGGQPF